MNKKGTVKLPNGKVLKVIPSDQIKVGAYRRMKKFDALVAENSNDPEKELELITLCCETISYLVPTISQDDMDDCSLSELGALMQNSMFAMAQDAGMVEEETSDSSPKARPRKRKTSK